MSTHGKHFYSFNYISFIHSFITVKFDYNGDVRIVKGLYDTYTLLRAACVIEYGSETLPSSFVLKYNDGQDNITIVCSPSPCIFRH